MFEHKWVYHRPKFVCEEHHPEVYVYAPWEGHRYFAYDYVRCIRPSTIVELGSHYGGSAFAFLQAMKDGRLDTNFYAVDTWQGDDFTRRDYDEDIFSHYRYVNETFFSEQKSHMLRMTFDEACAQFADESIDLLHIDGSHNYEDVKRDYLTWKDKVSKNGVIFFHDIGEDLVFGEIMGSHIFWEELKASGYLTLEVPYSNGLGMLFRSEELFTYIKETVDFSVYQQYYNLRGEEHKNALRKSLFQIRELTYHRDDLMNQVSVLNTHLEKYAQESATMKDYIARLEKDISGLNDFAAGKDRYIQELEERNIVLTKSAEEKQEHLTKYEVDVAAMKEYIAQLERNVSDLNDFAASKEKYIQELLAQKDSVLAYAQEQAARAEEKDKELTELAEEKETLEQKHILLQQTVEKIPFHKLWLKDLNQ